jgi:hypothetical protein
MKSVIVPRNKLQRQLSHSHHESLAPDPFATLEAPCTILKVYDAETIESEGVSAELADLLYNFPGLLFAQVQMQDNRTQFILPFKEPAEHIYTIYGNYVLLEGRSATICYINQDPQSGSIVMRRLPRTRHLPLNQLGRVYDIGAIL